MRYLSPSKLTYTVYCILYTVYCILYTVYCILYTVYLYCILYTVYCIPLLLLYITGIIIVVVDDMF